MKRKRIIPVLLIHKGLLYKSLKFSKHKYVGDPINAVKIFNEKEVDEIVILDIDASANGVSPNYKLISEISSEAFMPLSYGGGIKSIDQVSKILYSGVEKVIFNYSCYHHQNVIKETALIYGNSSTVVCIDVKKNIFGKYSCFSLNGTRNMKINPLDMVKAMVDLGAGEIIINNIDRDGMMSGYDSVHLKQICSSTNVPVIALGGAGDINDFKDAIISGASACAAGSMFVFHGPHKAVLITYPSQNELTKIYE